MKKILSIAVFWLLAGGQNLLMAQQRLADDRMRLLDECRTLFVQGDYGAAGTLLDEYERQAGTQDGLRAVESDYMHTVISAQLDPANAMKQIETFMNKYPESIYTNRMLALKGSSYFAVKSYAQAVECFDLTDPILLEERDCIRLLRHNAISLIRLGRIDEGRVQLGILEQMVEEPQTDEDIQFYKAYINYRHGRMDEATAGFTSSLEGRHQEEARLYMADIALNSDRGDSTAYAAATQLIEEAADPLIEAQAERILGEYWYRNGDYEKSYDLLTSYLALGTGGDERHDNYLLGMAALQAGHSDDAIKYLSQVAEGNDELAQNAALNMGLAALQKNDMNLARMAFERASAIPGKPQAREQALYNYAMIIHETNFSPFAESVTSFERFLNEFPNSPLRDRVSSYLTDVYLNTNNYDVALNSIAKIDNPGTSIMAARSQLLYNKSMEMIVSGQYQEATSLLTQAIAADRYDHEVAVKATFWRGEAYYRSGQTDKAEADYNRYLALESRKNQLSGLACYGLGYIAYDKKQYAKASQLMQEVIENASQTDLPQEMLADACLRAADCLFYTRNYVKAKDFYAMAMNMDSRSGDYALYQSGMVNGLQRDYNAKIADMSRLVASYPHSSYVPSALYEEGRAYQQTDRPLEAIKLFTRIIQDFELSELARKASAERALIYYQTGNLDEATHAYKQVIESYPGSDEARTAWVDLKSIYVERGDVNSFVAYSSSVTGVAPMANGERDSLTYSSAEGAFSRGDKDAALERFGEYLKQFPDGLFAANAWYYQGVLQEEKSMFDSAYESLMHAAAFENSRFGESALDRAASMEWNNQEWETAMDLFVRLYDKTANAGRKNRSIYSIVSCAGKIEDWDAVEIYADRAIQSQMSQEQLTEVKYWKAKALFTLGRGGEVRDLLEELSEDTRSQYGAESDYLLSQFLYDSGDMEGAEKSVMDFIKEGTPHTYWIARSFILLSDIYSSQGKDVEARQYLLSLQSNYTEDDDIAEMIEQRLE